MKTIRSNLIVVIAFVGIGLVWAGWQQGLCHKEPTHYLPHCAPRNGDIEPWKKSPIVGSTKEEIIKKFGKPGKYGIVKEPYYFLKDSDETWVYHGKGGGFVVRPGAHIFVFSKGKCVAASDDFIYTTGQIRKKSR